MERYRKLELIQRSLGIRHKLKVYDSMKAPDTHEDLSLMLFARWELEDELKAIEELLAETRLSAVAAKKQVLQQRGLESVTPERISERQREARRRLSDSIATEKTGSRPGG